MKFSERWLRECLPALTITHQELIEKLTMAGLEVEAVLPVANAFTGVVIGEVLSTTPHPDADRLRVCEVNVGQPEPLQIVCGAKNARPGIKVPAALVGAVLSPELTIKSTKLRGVLSLGMLCAPDELGIDAFGAEGLLELPLDAPVGMALSEYLQLEDVQIEVSLTPNRSDCLSVEGIVREVAALCGILYQPFTVDSVPVQNNDQLDIKLDTTDCPRYVGRVVRNVNFGAKTPLWLQERLRRSGLRPVNPIVDIMNYVMLALGQPLHAFDMAHIKGSITVRYGREGESLTLLDGRKVNVDPQTLVIADEMKPLALAGIMGGLDSAVAGNTQDIFLESAFFNPVAIAGRARRYGLHTDASLRFERGVDPNLPTRAIEYATQLLLEITGGAPGPVVCVETPAHLPIAPTIHLREARIARLLGIEIAPKMVAHYLQALGMEVTEAADGWEVTVPSYRFDLQIEEDLIEEAARLYGYDQITQSASSILVSRTNLVASETKIPLKRWRTALVGRDYHEIISYSFVAPALQQLLVPHYKGMTLANPISAELAQMRTSLWPGLVTALLYNQHRQQPRVRLFESGLRFIQEDDHLKQEPMLAALAWGQAQAEQWGSKTRSVDFYDVKGDVESLLALTKAPNEFRFMPSQHPALHPGQRCEIWRGEACVGYLGALHPQVVQELDIPGTVYVYEVVLSALETAILPKFATLSKYPAIRRDIAVWVNKETQAGELMAHIREVMGENLIGLQLFDVYEDKKGPEEKKSLAFGLVLQNVSRTLLDTEVNAWLATLVSSLGEKFRAVLRD